MVAAAVDRWLQLRRRRGPTRRDRCRPRRSPRCRPPSDADTSTTSPSPATDDTGRRPSVVDRTPSTAERRRPPRRHHRWRSSSPSSNCSRSASSTNRSRSCDVPLDQRLFIVEQSGRVRAVDDESDEVVLDISDLVSDGSEQGLLGLAFHPSADLAYVDYTDRSGDTSWPSTPSTPPPACSTRLGSRGPHGRPAATATTTAASWPSGPTGCCTSGSATAGSAGDPDRNGLDLATPLGKILRIDPVATGVRAVHGAGRQPVRRRRRCRPDESGRSACATRGASRSTPATGDLWIADVGQNEFEEIDHAPAVDGLGRRAWPELRMERLRGQRRVQRRPTGRRTHAARLRVLTRRRRVLRQRRRRRPRHHGAEPRRLVRVRRLLQRRHLGVRPGVDARRSTGRPARPTSAGSRRSRSGPTASCTPCRTAARSPGSSRPEPTADAPHPASRSLTTRVRTRTTRADGVGTGQPHADRRRRGRRRERPTRDDHRGIADLEPDAAVVLVGDDSIEHRHPRALRARSPRRRRARHDRPGRPARRRAASPPGSRSKAEVIQIGYRRPGAHRRPPPRSRIGRPDRRSGAVAWAYVAATAACHGTTPSRNGFVSAPLRRRGARPAGTLRCAGRIGGERSQELRQRLTRRPLEPEGLRRVPQPAGVRFVDAVHRPEQVRCPAAYSVSATAMFVANDSAALCSSISDRGRNRSSNPSAVRTTSCSGASTRSAPRLDLRPLDRARANSSNPAGRSADVTVE